jgi:hypothetical protein
MKHPEGAIKSILDFKKAAIPGAVFYMIFDRTSWTKFRCIVNEDFKITEDHKNCRWYFDMDVTDMKSQTTHPHHQFWSPYGDLHFPVSSGGCGFLFDNYWHAYAYGLKLRKSA